ncbi:MAG: hypothetical protein K0S12_503 [Bacteroidetes bacterium]|nr:hypothetical protein [Bacteroidota bacterium]
MKQLSILPLLLIGASLASCKKDYKCECTTNYSSGKSVSTREIAKATKKTATAICGDYQEVYTDTYNSGSGTVTYTETYNTNCELK